MLQQDKASWSYGLEKADCMYSSISQARLKTNLNLIVLLLKTIIWKTNSQYYIKWGEAGSIPSKIWNQRCPFLLLINIVLEILARAIGQK